MTLPEWFTTVDKSENTLPPEFSLSQNYPNPFNPTTTISYTLPKSGYVTIKVYNLSGRLVMTLVEGMEQPGNYNVIFDGTRLASGVYLYQLKQGNHVSTKKLILLK